MTIEIDEAAEIKTMNVKARIVGAEMGATEAERRINSKIRILIIIFIMKKPREKRASTRK